MITENIAVVLKENGFTDDEVEAFAFSVQLGRRVLALPVQHSMDTREFCNAIHLVQEKLLSRPILRAIQLARES